MKVEVNSRIMFEAKILNAIQVRDWKMDDYAENFRVTDIKSYMLSTICPAKPHVTLSFVIFVAGIK